MSKARQTPGPWSVNTDPRYEQGKPCYVWGPKGPGFGAVCEMIPVYPREFNEADARLIAAAPDLLAALVELLDAYEGSVDQCVCKEYRENLGKPPVPEDFCTTCLAKAAIAKATNGERNE